MLREIAVNDDAPEKDEDEDPAPNLPQEIKDWIDRHLKDEDDDDAIRCNQPPP